MYEWVYFSLSRGMSLYYLFGEENPLLRLLAKLWWTSLQMLREAQLFHSSFRFKCYRPVIITTYNFLSLQLVRYTCVLAV